jgi:hypothetical protein
VNGPVLLVDIRIKDILAGDMVWIAGELQEVLAVGAGSMPHHTELSTLTSSYQFPNEATLKSQDAQ